MLRKVVLSSGLVALVPAVKAATPLPNEGASDPNKPPKMRLSELPLYETPHADYVERKQELEKKPKTSYIRSTLEGPVRAVREQVQGALEQTSVVTTYVSDHYHEFQDRSDWIVKYLREEDNKDQRYGAVAIGGLTGFIFGLRGGFIRRLFYAGVGTTAMGYVCFPEETKEIVNSNSALAKQYINIAYNFLYGVKPGDPQLEVKFPELSLPKNFSGFVDLVTSVASTAKQAVMPPPSKESDSAPKDKKD